MLYAKARPGEYIKVATIMEDRDQSFIMYLHNLRMSLTYAEKALPYSAVLGKRTEEELADAIKSLESALAFAEAKQQETQVATT